MKKLTAILWLIAFCAEGAHVKFDLKDFVTGNISRRIFYVTPVSTPKTNLATIITSDSIRFYTETNGQQTVSNMVSGLYNVLIYGPQTNTIFHILVPDYTGLTNASDILTASTVAASGVAGYTIAQANALFVLKNSGWASNLLVTNLWLKGSTNVFKHTNGAVAGYYITTDGTNAYWAPATASGSQPADAGLSNISALVGSGGLVAQDHTDAYKIVTTSADIYSAITDTTGVGDGTTKLVFNKNPTIDGATVTGTMEASNLLLTGWLQFSNAWAASWTFYDTNGQYYTQLRGPDNMSNNTIITLPYHATNGIVWFSSNISLGHSNLQMEILTNPASGQVLKSFEGRPVWTNDIVGGAGSLGVLTNGAAIGSETNLHFLAGPNVTFLGTNVAGTNYLLIDSVATGAGVWQPTNSNLTDWGKFGTNLNIFFDNLNSSQFTSNSGIVSIKTKAFLTNPLIFGGGWVVSGDWTNGGMRTIGEAVFEDEVYIDNDLQSRNVYGTNIWSTVAGISNLFATNIFAVTNFARDSWQTNLTVSSNLDIPGHNATVNYGWVCTNATTGRGHWTALASTLFNVSNANVIHVRKDGDDATAIRGSFSKPFLTVTNALKAATNGDTILIYPGTYEFTAGFDTAGEYYLRSPSPLVIHAKTNLTIQGFGFNSVLDSVNSYGDFFVISNCQDIAIKNLSMFSTNPGAGLPVPYAGCNWAAVHLLGTNKNILIEGVHFKNHMHQGISDLPNPAGKPKGVNVVVRNCRFENIGVTNQPAGQSWDGACAAGFLDSWRFEFNYATNILRGIEVYHYETTACKDVNIANNTFDGVLENGIYVINAVENLSIQNNYFRMRHAVRVGGHMEHNAIGLATAENDVRIVGNHCEWLDVPASMVASGVSLGSATVLCTNIQIANNHFGPGNTKGVLMFENTAPYRAKTIRGLRVIGNSFDRLDSYAIDIAAHDADIIHNYITDCGDGVGAAIRFFWGDTTNTIRFHDNTITHPRATPPSYVFHINTALGNFDVRQNKIEANSYLLDIFNAAPAGGRLTYEPYGPGILVDTNLATVGDLLSWNTIGWTNIAGSNVFLHAANSNLFVLRNYGFATNASLYGFTNSGNGWFTNGALYLTDIGGNTNMLSPTNIGTVSEVPLQIWVSNKYTYAFGVESFTPIAINYNDLGTPTRLWRTSYLHTISCSNLMGHDVSVGSTIAFVDHDAAVGSIWTCTNISGQGSWSNLAWTALSTNVLWTTNLFQIGDSDLTNWSTLNTNILWTTNLFQIGDADLTNWATMNTNVLWATNLYTLELNGVATNLASYGLTNTGNLSNSGTVYIGTGLEVNGTGSNWIDDLITSDLTNNGAMTNSGTLSVGANLELHRAFKAVPVLRTWAQFFAINLSSNLYQQVEITGDMQLISTNRTAGAGATLFLTNSTAGTVYVTNNSAWKPFATNAWTLAIPAKRYGVVSLYSMGTTEADVWANVNDGSPAQPLDADLSNWALVSTTITNLYQLSNANTLAWSSVPTGLTNLYQLSNANTLAWSSIGTNVLWVTNLLQVSNANTLAWSSIGTNVLWTTNLMQVSNANTLAWSSIGTNVLWTTNLLQVSNANTLAWSTRTTNATGGGVFVQSNTPTVFALRPQLPLTNTPAWINSASQLTNPPSQETVFYAGDSTTTNCWIDLSKPYQRLDATNTVIHFIYGTNRPVVANDVKSCRVKIYTPSATTVSFSADWHVLNTNRVLAAGKLAILSVESDGLYETNIVAAIVSQP